MGMHGIKEIITIYKCKYVANERKKKKKTFLKDSLTKREENVINLLTCICWDTARIININLFIFFLPSILCIHINKYV